jgi:organic radical activating enzyme
MSSYHNFCKHLTNGLVINNNSKNFTISPCCYFNKNYETNDLNPEDIFGNKLNNIDVNETCRLCLNQEKQGRTSYRHSSFDVIKDNNNLIQFLTIAVTKTCNLACPSCDAGASSFWFQENLRHGVDMPAEIKQQHQDTRHGLTDQKLLDWFGRLDTSGLRYLKIGGGEPMMNKTHFYLLERIKNPQDVVVQYTTNYTIMPSEEIMELWSKFKLVKWVGSIDGIHERFEYLRWPAKFNKIEKVITETIKRAPNNVMFGVEHTVNPLNVFYYDEMLEWFNNTMSTNRLGDASDFNIHPCEGHLSISNTPMAVRQLIKDKYGSDHFLSIMLDQYQYKDSDISKKWLDKVDNWRKQSWRKTFSEIQEYF